MCGVLNRKANLVFTICRDLRDVIASTKRKNPPFKNGNVIEIGKNHLKWYNDWVEKSNYEFKYESYKQNPIKIINEIAEVLGFEVDAEKVHKQAESLKDNKNLPKLGLRDNEKEKVEFYKDTIMAEHHITNNGKIGGHKDNLTPKEIKLIETHFKSWLTKKGYLNG